ncbi:MAG: hypothetical protein HKN31_07665 [Pricia sp.]|nr:hypothetical protein [Pricia sp.]
METLTIPKHIDNQDDRDYGFLRQVGLQHIEAMSSKLWTDYNTHDPGITFLEVLCYAITDLGYRINAPIPDLVAEPISGTKNLKDTFPTAKEILTTKPISERDYRKLFIDVPGVKNAFIRPNREQKVFMHCSLKDEVTPNDPKGKLSYENDFLPDYEKQNEFMLQGLNNIFFEMDSNLQQLEKEDPERIAKVEEIIKVIRETYHANRNLCEDLVKVEEVGEYEFQVCGDIEIEKTANAHDTVVEILLRIQEHVSPSIKRYTLAQLLEEGETTDNIYNGPILKHGFITDEELENANIQTEIRLSDLVQIIAETPGVASIRDISMMSCPCNQEGEEAPEPDCEPQENKWKICFPKGFDKVLKLCLNNSVINVFKDVIPINIDQEKIQNDLQEKFKEFNTSLELSYDDIAIPDGNYLNSGEYHSIQNDLPTIYGIGEAGLSPKEPVERHAQALQLKAYLTFFDQILATYFSHLENIGKLLSGNMHGSQTYYLDQLTDIKNLDKIIKNAADYDEDANAALGNLDDFISRKGKLLDHLLARFSENMNDYVFLMIDLFGLETKEASLWHKAKLLEEYADLGYNRGKAFNFNGTQHGVWDTLNVSGLQHRIARLLGIRDYSRRDMTSYYYEFYPELDSDPSDDPNDEWRWRIRHTDNTIMFSSSKHYDSMIEAEDELWKTISLAWDEANYDLLPTEDGTKWYFNLIDKSKEVVARHIQYYPDKTDAEATIKEYAAFMFDKVTDEGLFLFENILLRPDVEDSQANEKFMEICVEEDCEQCKPQDPYSFRVTIVLPGWTKRFSNLDFREFAEDVIRAEVPAHILTRICWIGSPLKEKIQEDEENMEPSQMKQLEELYKKWLQLKMESPQDQSGNTFLKPLVDLLHKLDTVYPAGTLHDCNVDGEAGTSIILNKSSLGELKKKENGSE